MMLLPVADWINGIAMVPKAPPRVIEIPNQKPGTRCYLIEAVGPKAFEAGFRPGDVVVAKSVFDLFFFKSAFHRVKFKLEEIMDEVPNSIEQFTTIDGKEILPTLDPKLIAARKERETFLAGIVNASRASGAIL